MSVGEEPPKKKRAHATRDEVFQRVAVALEMIRKGYLKCEIKRAFKKQFNVSGKMTEHYLSIARKQMLDHLNQPVHDLRSVALQRYESVIRNPKSRPIEVLKAQQLIDRLLGLRVPDTSFIGVKNLDEKAGNSRVIEVEATKRKLSGLTMDQLQAIAAMKNLLESPRELPQEQPIRTYTDRPIEVKDDEEQEFVP